MKIDLPLVIYEPPPSLEVLRTQFKGGVKYIERVQKVWWKAYFRTMLSEQQNHRCAICGVHTDLVIGSKRRATIEHVLPQCRGGKDIIEHCVMACDSCNNKRGESFLPEEEIIKEWENSY